MAFTACASQCLFQHNKSSELDFFDREIESTFFLWTNEDRCGRRNYDKFYSVSALRNVHSRIEQGSEERGECGRNGNAAT